MKLKQLIYSIISKIFGVNPVYYINGPDILPPPLTSEEEQQLLQSYDGIDPDTKEILITRNLRLVVYIAKKYDAPGTNIEDIISIGSIGLIKAVNTFCPERNIKLATYASRCIENEILMYLRKYSGIKNEISIDEPLNFDPDGNELLLSDVLGTEFDEISVGLEAEDERKTLLRLVNNLSSREREIMCMRFGLAGYSELTQKEVADKLGISQSYISRLEKRILSKLKTNFEALV
ncbi:MAG: sigma-70 family RNA polymerase sigma factor [Clostridia bacterium]|nr:sigma-70 family RNA polymerase sigma factor [Clostridia bacterium]